MDAIETIDWGAYAHFTFVAQKYPDLAAVMAFPYYLSTYVVLLAFMSCIIVLFIVQNRKRAALVTTIGLVVSLGIIEFSRFLLPRLRPPDAENWLGPGEMLGSYPSAGVFLFMLMMIFLGLAYWPWLPRTWMRVGFVSIAAMLTVSVAMSQLFLALHYVSDIIGGIVGAALVGYIVYRYSDAPKSPISAT